MLSPELITQAINLSPLLIPIVMAFSGKVRDQAIGRAGNRSEISGSGPQGRALTVMHLDHTKDETYNTVERALVVTDKEHLIYHRVHRGKAHEIGLTEEENEGAISLLSSIIKKLGLL